MCKPKGFTLAEILVVIGVLSIVGVLVLTIFTRSLRGSNKSQILASIKQNGQSVLENMDKLIRSSDNVACVSSDTLAVVKNGEYTRFRFLPPNINNPAKGSCLSTNGCITADKVIQPPPPAPESDLRLFINNLCIGPSQSPQILTDTNPQTGVSLENGSFSRSQQPGSKDVVTIKFNLLPGKKAPQAVAGQIDAVTFETTIQLR